MQFWFLISTLSVCALFAIPAGAEPVVRANLSISDDGQLAATGNADGTLLLWQTSDWSLRLRHPASDLVFGYDISPDNRLVAFGSRDGRAIVLDVESNKRVFDVQDRDVSVNAVRFGADGRLYAAGEGGFITAYDWRSGVKLGSFGLGSDALVEDFEVVPGGNTLLVARFDDQARLIDGDSGELIHSWRNDRRERDGQRVVKDVEVSPDGAIGYFSGVNGRVFVVNLESGQRLGSVAANPDFVSAMALSPDGSVLAVNDLDGNTLLIDTETLEIVKRLKQTASFGSGRLLFAVSFAGNADRLVTGGIRLPLIEWHVGSGERVATIETVPALAQTAAR